jgi:hypothetical protein
MCVGLCIVLNLAYQRLQAQTTQALGGGDVKGGRG